MNVKDLRAVSASLSTWRERVSRYRRNWKSKRLGDPRRAYWFAQLKTAKKMVARRERQLAAIRSPVAVPVPSVTADSWDYHPPVHDGIDLICPPDAKVYAICDAEVVDVRASGWWGKGAPANKAAGDGIIQIWCTVSAGPFRKGLVFAYGHAEKATVKVGDKVKAGDLLGHAGLANAWHVHFMVHDETEGLRGVGDRDPRPFLDYAKAKA